MLVRQGSSAGWQRSATAGGLSNRRLGTTVPVLRKLLSVMQCLAPNPAA